MAGVGSTVAVGARAIAEGRHVQHQAHEVGAAGALLSRNQSALLKLTQGALGRGLADGVSFHESGHGRPAVPGGIGVVGQRQEHQGGRL